MDRDTTELLSWLNAGGAAGIDPTDMAKARGGYDALFRELGGPIPKDVKTRDIAVPGKAGWIPVRVYRPGPVDHRSLPTVLFLHGGGWSMGGHDSYDALVAGLAARSGCRFMSVSYRLAPECRYPAALDDAASVLEWMTGRWDTCTQAPVAVCGDSAGGTLAAVLAQLHSDRIAAQVLLYPVLTLGDAADLASRQQLGNGEYFLSRDGIAWAAQNYLGDPAASNDRRVSPLLGDLHAGMPAGLVVTAGYDPLRDEGALYAQRLTEAGVDAELVCFEQTIHGFMSFAGRLSAGREGIAMVGDWLKRRMGAT